MRFIKGQVVYIIENGKYTKQRKTPGDFPDIVWKI